MVKNTLKCTEIKKKEYIWEIGINVGEKMDRHYIKGTSIECGDTCVKVFDKNELIAQVNVAEYVIRYNPQDLNSRSSL
jgi:hypothetical protein